MYLEASGEGKSLGPVRQAAEVLMEELERTRIPVLGHNNLHMLNAP